MTGDKQRFALSIFKSVLSVIRNGYTVCFIGNMNLKFRYFEPNNAAEKARQNVEI